MKKFESADWLVLSPERRAAHGLDKEERLPVVKEHKMFKQKKLKKKDLTIPFHELCF